MRIQPTQQTPNFGLVKQTRIRFTAPYTKVVTDTVTLANGKKAMFAKTYSGNTLESKLSYLKDAAGNWVKSRLRYYKGGKIIKELVSEAKTQEKE